MAGWRRGRRCLPSIILASCLLGQANLSAAAEPLRMMLLFGTADAGVWSQRFNAAFFKHPHIRDGVRPVSVAVEYLGLYQATPEGVDRVRALLEYKQQMAPVDLVIAVQGIAGRFLADHGEQIYPGVPRLYMLPGRAVAEEVAADADSLVLRSAIREAIPETVSVMDAMLPELEEVLVVTGTGGLDSVYADFARSTLAGHPARAKVRFLHGLGLEELGRRLDTAPATSAALLLTYEGDPEGRVYRTADVLTRLTATSAVPIFIAYDSLLGQGAVGGVMTSTARYGEQAASMALEMVTGGDHAMPHPEPATRLAFDALQMRRHGLPLSRVPEGSELINHVQPVYLGFLPEILAALAVFVLQLLLIVALLRLLRQRKRAARVLTRQARDLQRQKVLFESVINSIPDAIVITSVEARIVATNRDGFEATFGYAPDRVVGESCAVLTGGRELMELERAVDQGQSMLEFGGAGGHCFPGEWTSTRVMTETGEHLGYVLVVRDVTERLAREEERRQAHKMEALGSLAGGIAHDFNNILTIILGNAELIGADPGSALESASNILRAGQRARELVAQILTFSRKGKSRSMQPVDLRNLFDESVGFLRSSLPTNVRLQVEVADDLDMAVRADESQLQQVLLNLCANARDAMGEAGGQLSLRLFERRVDRGTIVSHGVLRRGSYLCMEVTDTGQGMSADLLRRVFDPFFTTKGPGEGTGMGLALVYGIVRAHEGAIHVSSAAGAGTRFEIYLPALDGASVDSPSAAPQIMPGNGERILVAEDDPSVRGMLEGMLQRLGYVAESYADPAAALAAFARAPRRYAVVLTDRAMPDMDGLSLCRSIRRQDPLVPLLLCSGYGDAVEAEAQALLEPIELLAKPYRATDLAAALRRMLLRSEGRLEMLTVPGDQDAFHSPGA